MRNTCQMCSFFATSNWNAKNIREWFGIDLTPSDYVYSQSLRNNLIRKKLQIEYFS